MKKLVLKLLPMFKCIIIYLEELDYMQVWGQLDEALRVQQGALPAEILYYSCQITTSCQTAVHWLLKRHKPLWKC